MTAILGAWLFLACAQGAEAGQTKDVPPLSMWSEDDFARTRYASYLLEGLLADAGRPVRSFRSQLFTLVIGMANAIGEEEEPRKAFTRALRYFTEQLGFRQCGEGPNLERVLPSSVMEKRCGTPLAVTALFLALIDRQVLPGEEKPRFALKPFLVPGAVLLRYQFDTYSLTLVPAEGTVILSDSEVAKRWPAEPRLKAAGFTFRPLKPRELAGLLLAELAEAYARSANEALRERFLQKAVSFFPRSPELRIRAARLLLRASRPQEALTHADFVLRHLPENGEALFLRGVALFELQRSAEAEAALKAAIARGYTAGGKAWLYLAHIASSAGALNDLHKYLAALRAESSDPALKARIDSLLKEATAKRAAGMLRPDVPYEKRFAVIDLLARDPSPSAVEALIGCLSDPNYRFRAYAWRALREISGVRLPLKSDAWWEWYRKNTGASKKNLWAELTRGIGPSDD